MPKNVSSRALNKLKQMKLLNKMAYDIKSLKQRTVRR